jgi:hypothetical protein
VPLGALKSGSLLARGAIAAGVGPRLSKRIKDFDGLVSLPFWHRLHQFHRVRDPLVAQVGVSSWGVHPTVWLFQLFFDSTGEIVSHHPWFAGFRVDGHVPNLRKRRVRAVHAHCLVQFGDGPEFANEFLEARSASLVYGLHPKDYMGAA